MSNSGRAINIFLINGDPSGFIQCTLEYRTGVAYKIPRYDLHKCGNRDHLRQNGVYFLFGKPDDQVVYIGQGGVRENGKGVLGRVREHDRDSEKEAFWNDAVIFTTLEDSLGPTELCYLENRFYTLAKETERYIVNNDNTPSPGNPSESKKCWLDEFIDDVKIILGVLGHKVFEPLVKSRAAVEPDAEKSAPCDTEPVFRIRKQNVFVEGVRTNEGFVLLKGGKLKSTLAPSLRPAIKKLRDHYKDIIDENFVLKDNLLLRSPNEAANFVLGTPVNATEWETEDGKTFKDFET